MTQTKPFNYVELNTLKSWNCPVFKIFQLFCVQRRPMDPYETISFQMHKKRAQPVRSLLREITRYQIVWACSNSNASEWYVSNDIVKHWIMKKWRHNYHMCYLFSVHRCARLRLHTRFLFYTFFPLCFILSNGRFFIQSFSINIKLAMSYVVKWYLCIFITHAFTSQVQSYFK